MHFTRGSRCERRCASAPGFAGLWHVGPTSLPTRAKYVLAFETCQVNNERLLYHRWPVIGPSRPPSRRGDLGHDSVLAVCRAPEDPHLGAAFTPPQVGESLYLYKLCVYLQASIGRLPGPAQELYTAFRRAEGVEQPLAVCLGPLVCLRRCGCASQQGHTCPRPHSLTVMCASGCTR